MAAVYVGCRGISGLTAGLFFARILLQQLTTALYEELNYRFLILEGYFHGNKSVWSRLLYAFVSFLVFGPAHVVTGWSTSAFFLSGAIGFTFAVIYLKSGNIVIPMLLLNEILQKGFDGGNFIAGLSTHLRNLLVARDQSTLSLLGTFLVRSGVLTSVHAFATDPERGLFILAFLIIVIGLSFLLFAWRAPTVGLGGNFSLISRESMLLVNNVLLVVAMGAVLLGTLYPLFLDALNAGKISVGPPYFDAVFGPLMLPCVFLMGVGPLARWKDADPKALARELAWCLVAAIVAGAAIPLLMGEFGHWVFLGCTSAMFVFFAVIQTFRHQIRNQPGNVFARLMRQPRAFWGMQFAHIGVAVFIIGVALVKGYQSERDVRMYEGETVTVAGYTFTFNGVETVRGPNYTADRGDFTLSVNGRELQHLYPEKRKYYSSNSMPMTESAIRHSITGDVYVSLGTPTNDGGWVVRAYYKPYVTWIWWGCIIMAAAGLWAASDRRYRRRKQKNEADGE